MLMGTFVISQWVLMFLNRTLLNFFQHAENCWIRNFNGGLFLTFLNTNWSWLSIFTDLGSIFWIFKSASASSLPNFFTVLVLDAELFSSSSFWVLDLYGLFCEWRIRGRGGSWFSWVWDDELVGLVFFYTITIKKLQQLPSKRSQPSK